LARVWILPVEEEKKETGRTQVLETKTWGTRPLPILVPGHPSFQLIGYVVMPEHVHLLISEPQRGAPSTVLQKLKLRVARKLRKRRRSTPAGQMHLPFEERGEPLRAFWQARFYDFNVYSERKRIEKLNYMHANPMNRRLVKHPKDWPWSSWGFYTRVGKVLVQIDV